MPHVTANGVVLGIPLSNKVKQLFPASFANIVVIMEKELNLPEQKKR